MIRVTKLADYGVLLMSWFAKAQDQFDRLGVTDPRPVAASDLARETGLPVPTVAKLARLLTRHGLLDSVRGAQGGYRLARPASQISVGALVEAIEGPLALTECLDTSTTTCAVQRLCSTRENWERINGAIKSALDGISLEEIALPTRGWRERMSKSMAHESLRQGGGDLS